MSMFVQFTAASVVFVLSVCGAVVILRSREGRVHGGGWFRAVMVGALLVGTLSHWEDLITHGIIPAPGQPLLFNLYWSSLAIADPIGAGLLVFAVRSGVVATSLIIGTDLVVNVVAFGQEKLFTTDNWPLAFQAVFGLFVALTGPICWRQRCR